MSIQGSISPAPEAKGRHGGKVLTSTIAAQSIEFYDFVIYGTAASLVFNKAFFPSSTPVAGVLAAFATFAVGFAARPAGAVVFGHIGDKFGRKPALLGSTLAMAVATTLIGLLPTFATLGAAAPVLLVLCRVVQGLAVGGVWGGATLLAMEYAPANRRGLYAAIPQIGTFAGMIFGTLVFIIVTQTVAAADFAAWGWRVPFLLSIVMFPVVIYIHRFIEDSPEFREAEKKLEAKSAETKKQSSVVQVLRRPKHMLMIAFIFVPATIMFYLTATGMLDYGVRELKIAKPTMLTIVMLSMVVTLIFTIVFGWLSDFVGRRPIYMAGVAVAGVWSFVLFPLMETRDFGLALLAIGVGQLTVAAMFGPGVTMFAEMFPAGIRYSGASMGYQLANILGGGLAPFIMVALLESTHTSISVSAYFSAFAVLSLFTLWLARPRQDQPTSQEPVEQAG